MAQTVEAGGGAGAGWADGSPPPFTAGVQQINFAGKTYYYQPPTGKTPGFVVFPGLGWISNVSSVNPTGNTINIEAPTGQVGGGVISLGNNAGTLGMSLYDSTTGKNTIMPVTAPALPAGQKNPYVAPAPTLVAKPTASPAVTHPTSTVGGGAGGAGGGGGGGVVGGGGGFGGGGGVPPNLAPATTYNAQQLEAQYGYAAEFFKDTGLQKLVQQAVANQWDPANFAAHLMGTSWYKTHSAAQRQWEQLRTSDPAEARSQQQQMALEITNRAGKDGVTLSAARVAQLASSALQFGWNSSKIDSALASEYRYTSGNPGAIATGLKQQAAQYLVPISDQTLQTWSQHMIAGSVDQNAFDAYLKEQAKSLFPGMGAAIDSGVTPKTYVQPYADIASQTLEIPPDSVNFLDPKWSKALFQTDPKTGARTSMSLSDWQSTLRTDPSYGYDKTQQARTAAADLTTRLAQTFGAA